MKTNKFDVSVFIITPDKQYIIADEYDNKLDSDGLFVMLTNDELNRDFGDDNSICLYKNWIEAVNKVKREFWCAIDFEKRSEYASCPWQVKNEKIPNNEYVLNIPPSLKNHYDNLSPIWGDFVRRHHLDGYKSNTEIMKNSLYLAKKQMLEEYLPAIMVAFHTEVLFDGRLLHGFLPAIGQLIYIGRNINKINNAFKKTDTDFKSFKLSECWWWSATEYDAFRSWSMYDESQAIYELKSH